MPSLPQYNKPPYPRSLGPSQAQHFPFHPLFHVIPSNTPTGCFPKPCLHRTKEIPEKTPTVANISGSLVLGNHVRLQKQNIRNQKLVAANHSSAAQESGLGRTGAVTLDKLSSCSSASESEDIVTAWLPGAGAVRRREKQCALREGKKSRSALALPAFNTLQHYIRRPTHGPTDRQTNSTKII